MKIKGGYWGEKRESKCKLIFFFFFWYSNEASSAVLKWWVVSVSLPFQENNIRCCFSLRFSGSLSKINRGKEGIASYRKPHCLLFFTRSQKWKTSCRLQLGTATWLLAAGVKNMIKVRGSPASTDDQMSSDSGVASDGNGCWLYN